MNKYVIVVQGGNNDPSGNFGFLYLKRVLGPPMEYEEAQFNLRVLRRTHEEEFKYAVIISYEG